MSELVENQGQENIMSVLEQLIQASKKGNAKEVKSLLEKESGLFMMITELKVVRDALSLSLSYAEQGGHTEVVNILKPYCSRSAGGRLLLFTYIPIFGINFICGLYVFLMKKKTPTGQKIYKYDRFSRIVAIVGVVLWAAIVAYTLL